MNNYIFKNKRKIKNIKNLNLEEGFNIASKNKVFSNLILFDIDITKKYVMQLVSKKYDILTNDIMELLTDDESDDNGLIVMNNIERFRIVIKNKYKDYIDSETLKLMGRNLGQLQKLATEMEENKKKNMYMNNNRVR